MDLIQEYEKALPFADVITKASLFSQTFENHWCWSCCGVNPQPPSEFFFLGGVGVDMERGEATE